MIRPFWQGKRVFVTGHTGFKGSWLVLWLERLGAKVSGYSLPPEGDENLFDRAGVAQRMRVSTLADIGDVVSLNSALEQSDPEVIFHLAAQPLVRRSYKDPIETYATNVMGTVHLLEGARRLKNLRSVVIVTTDKVYRNLESAWPYRESDVLGGHDPYSASKAACEIVVESFRNAFYKELGVPIASARADNVIGGGDWAEDRLIPDIVRAWRSGQIMQIRRPDATRPWQHVLEPLYGYLTLAEHIWDTPDRSDSFNFGPERSDAISVGKIVSSVQTFCPELEVICDTVPQGPHETNRLLLDNLKAEIELDVRPMWNVHQAISHTMQWYQDFYAGAEAFDCCLADVTAYESALTSWEQSR